MESFSEQNQLSSSNLRQRAESLLDKKITNLGSLSTEDIINLVHELQVHQIELEMQNDELQNSERRYQLLYQQFVDLYEFAPFGYLVIEKPDRIKEANVMAAKMLGAQHATLIGRRFTDFLPQEEQDLHFLTTRTLFVCGTPQYYMLKLKPRKDKISYIKVELHPDKDDSGHIISYRMAMIDITELKHTEFLLKETLTKLEDTQSQLIQQERLAAVGQLAAGIAHDFNNILTIIASNAELAMFSPELPVSTQRHLHTITQTGERATRLVKQILDFSQKSIQRKENLDLMLTCKNLIQFLRHTIPEHIHISVHAEPGEYWVEADPTQLHQVFTNLIINARDAMPQGGQLTINLSHIVISHKSIFLHNNQHLTGHWICVEIADTGNGIPSEHLPHIFEPFFTTKKEGRGVGLGLSQVHGIIKQHGWHIEVTSQVHQRTIFTLYLTPSSKPGEPPTQKPLEPTVCGHGEKILLVEDDANVLSIMQQILESLNYQVIPAANGQVAYKLYQEHRGDIDLVLSDMIMPDMDGEELFQTLKSYNPELKMILISGYPLGNKGTKLIDQGLVAWLQKPVPLQTLSQCVGKALALR